MQIMLGEHDLRVFDGTEQLMKTDTIIWHPRDASVRPILLSRPTALLYDYQTLDHDIMMIKMFHPVTFTDAIKPIPLPTGCPIGGIPCMVSGWGNTQIETVSMPTKLQCLDVPTLDDRDCENAYPGMITRTMLCAGYLDGGRDACNVCTLGAPMWQVTLGAPWCVWGSCMGWCPGARAALSPIILASTPECVSSCTGSRTPWQPTDQLKPLCPPSLFLSSIHLLSFISLFSLPPSEMRTLSPFGH
ncbi:hypothetical protein JZ751_007446 [Albula glossodonta]|uniref:trypsin n=1 Tax=Albula glossodonta TaxID=121402 RepID=A0A8T2N380_9TELE|nr:hypothetical protein JZ751_007446 [Albula glossodonta]